MAPKWSRTNSIAGAILLWAALAAGQTFERGPTHSPHGPLAIACGSCHTATSWRPIRAIPEFNHNRETRFPLRGMHQNVQCAQCHQRLVFAETGTKCADCHADIHRSQFGARCEECHTVRGWTVQTQALKQHSNRFPLLGAHATVSCDSCHTGGAQARYVGLSTACASCHMAEYNQARPLDHKAANLPLTCEQCHGFDSWTALSFDHNRFTNFPLTGVHARLDCVTCHVGGRFAGTPADCFSCHAKDFNSANDPPHIQAGFPHDCGVCHSTQSWQGARFDHNAMTKFALTGAHVQLDCNACHAGGRFAGTPTNCVGCHLADYQKSQNPPHVAANISTDCASCHTTVAWQGAKFDHSRSSFPLTGAHAQVACDQCHVGHKFAGLPTDCEGCHLADFQKTNNPNHAAVGISQHCVTCHNTTSWLNASFDHNSTKFPLTGAHVNLQCAQCHVNNQFVGLSTQCVSCHLADFQKTNNPNHVTAGFPQDCTLCHTTTAWQPASFDHNRTKFPLTGAHVNLQCAQCHVNNQFVGLSTQCVSCHLVDFQKTNNPNHVAAGFPQDCSICHTTTTWQGAKFDHNAATKFPLTGAHVNLQCSQCHKNNVFAGTATQCVGCHLADFQKANNPNHVTAGFPQDCTICHNTTAWQPASFDHSKTPFPLTGAHLTVQCAQCHKNGQFAGTPTQCAACHLADFNKTANPNHVAAGFPQDCSLCHSTVNWQGATFDHSKTPFPLTGAHLNVQCAQCHVNNQFAGLSTACVSCHLKDYQGTTNPNHTTAGFPQQCEVCHTTTAWQPASFDHSKTNFPLTGAHVKVQCANCHIGGRFAGTPTACYACHSSEYNSTTNPNHVAAGFPQDCSLCHTTTSWSGAVFDHTWFPIYSGSHAGKWTTCADCHTNPSNYAVFSCTNCHAHEQTRMDSEHRGVRNYVYNSTNCYACHPTGRGGG